MMFPFDFFYYMHVIFLIWQCPDIQVIAIHAFPKIYLDMKMLGFVAKKENMLAGLYMFNVE